MDVIFSLEAKRFILSFRSWPLFIQADMPFRGLLWTALALSWKQSEVWKPRSQMGWHERKTIDHSWTARTSVLPSRRDMHLSIGSDGSASSPKKEHQGAAGDGWGTVPKSYWEWAVPQSVSVCLLVPKQLHWGRQGYPEGIGRSRPKAPAGGDSETCCPKLVSFVFLTKSKAVEGRLLVFLAGYHPKKKCWVHFSAVAFSTT